MRIRLFPVLVVATSLLSLIAHLGQAADKAPGSSEKGANAAFSSEIAAIRAGSQAFTEAVNKRDAKAVAALWTMDGEFIDDVGRKYQGRAAIEKGYAQFFARNPNAKLRIAVDSVRLLSENAAMEDGRAFLDPPPLGNPGLSKYSVVHVKVDGKWLMASVRDQWIESPSTYENVADLEWLIGIWVSEEHGTKMESVCQWIANKSFVERRYTVTQPNGTSHSGVQIIGWNPETRFVQSWNFSSDGGHAIGVWSPRENGWSAEIRGVIGTGVTTTAVNLLTRLDDNAYVWQSVQRTLGDQELPDTDEVVLKRTTKTP